MLDKLHGKNNTNLSEENYHYLIEDNKCLLSHIEILMYESIKNNKLEILREYEELYRKHTEKKE